MNWPRLIWSTDHANKVQWQSMSRLWWQGTRTRSWMFVCYIVAKSFTKGVILYYHDEQKKVRLFFLVKLLVADNFHPCHFAGYIQHSFCLIQRRRWLFFIYLGWICFTVKQTWLSPAVSKCETIIQNAKLLRNRQPVVIVDSQSETSPSTPCLSHPKGTFPLFTRTRHGHSMDERQYTDRYRILIPQDAQNGQFHGCRCSFAHCPPCGKE